MAKLESKRKLAAVAGNIQQGSPSKSQSRYPVQHSSVGNDRRQCNEKVVARV